MYDEITLTDLFEVEMLQRIQDAFAKMTGLAAQITDANGKPITRGSNYGRRYHDWLLRRRAGIN